MSFRVVCEAVWFCDFLSMRLFNDDTTIANFLVPRSKAETDIVIMGGGGLETMASVLVL